MAGIDPISGVVAGLGAVAKLAALPSSIRDQRRAQRSLDKLQSTPMARYSISPEVRKMYEQSVAEASAPQGFGGATISSFRQGLARGQRGRFSQAMNASGGQGSRAINAILSGINSNEYSNFAIGNENLMRANRMSALGRSGSYASQFQNINNMNTSQDINRRTMLEQGYGQAIRSQKDFRRNMFSGMGSDLITAGVVYGMGGGKVDSGYNRDVNGLERLSYRMNPDSYVGAGTDVNLELLGANGQRALLHPEAYRPSRFGRTNGYFQN